MDRWCNEPLVVWAFIVILWLFSLWFIGNNFVCQLSASYTSTASNINKQPITPGLLYLSISTYNTHRDNENNLHMSLEIPVSLQYPWWWHAVVCQVRGVAAVWISQYPYSLDIPVSLQSGYPSIPAHSVSECGFQVPKTYQAPAHIWDLPRWWKSLLLMYKIFDRRTFGLSHQIKGPTTVKLAGKIVFWWQGMNFYPLNPKMGIKDNFISKWF